MNIKSTFLISIVLVSASMHSYSAKFYKWTDENGNTHYSDKAPAEGTEAETVHVNTLKPSRTEHRLPAFNNIQDAAESVTEKENNEEMQAFCENLAKNMETLKKGGAVQTIDSEGNKQLLNEEERSQKLTQYNTQFEKNCLN